MAHRSIGFCAAWFLAALATALLAFAPAAQAQAGAVAVKPVRKGDAVAATASPVDVELLLRSCAGEAHRNAKLYVARAHGIDLMKRSADRTQGRSMLRIEAHLDGTLGQLRGKHGAQVDRELDSMEDALVGLTELTLQQPLVAQTEAALRLAERAAQACGSTVGRVVVDAASATRLRHLASLLATSQQLSGRFLAASLKPGGPTAPESTALRQLAAEFETELAWLHGAKANDTALRDMVVLLDGQWLFMRQALTKPSDNARAKIEDVGRASELMFELIDGQMQRLRRTA